MGTAARQLLLYPCCLHTNPHSSRCCAPIGIAPCQSAAQSFVRCKNAKPGLQFCKTTHCQMGAVVVVCSNAPVGAGLRAGVARAHILRTRQALNSGCPSKKRPLSELRFLLFLPSSIRRSTCLSLPGFLVYPSPSLSCSCFLECFELASIPFMQTTQTLCRSAKPAAQGFALVQG